MKLLLIICTFLALCACSFPVLDEANALVTLVSDSNSSITSSSPSTTSASTTSTSTSNSTDACGGCSVNGTCVNGLCKCVGNWTGARCESEPISVKVSCDPDVPIVAFPVPSGPKFSVKFLSIHELGPENETLGPTQLGLNTSGIFAYEYLEANSTSPAIIWRYSSVLPNSAVLNFTLVQYRSLQHIIFAQRNVTVPANAVKLTISVANWIFQNANSKLGISMELTHNTSSANISSNRLGDLSWTSLSTGNHSLFSEFIEDSLVDGTVQKVKFLRKGSIITAIIPRFSRDAVIDPNFSVLPKPKSPAPPKPKPSYGRVGMVIGVSIGVIAFVVIGSMAVLMLYPGLRTRYLVSKGEVSVEMRGGSGSGSGSRGSKHSR